MLNVKISGIATLKAYMTSEGDDVQNYCFTILFSSDILVFEVFYFRYFYFPQNLDKSKSFKFSFFRDF